MKIRRQIREIKRRAIRLYLEKKYPSLKNWTFIHINKTGGTSIEKALALSIEHLTAIEKREQVGEQSWLDSLTFAVIRNPWSKVVSQYHYRLRTDPGLLAKPLPLKDWIKAAFIERDPLYCNKTKFFVSQCAWICDLEGKVIVDNVLRQESLNQDFLEMASKFNIPLTLPHVKKSIHKHYSTYYDREMIECVGEIFHEDIVRFDYTFEQKAPQGIQTSISNLK